jgi:hypothetical protein
MFFALFLAIDVSSTHDNVAITTELKGALEHHPQRFLSDLRPTSVKLLFDFRRIVLLLKSCMTSLLTSLYCGHAS